MAYLPYTKSRKGREEDIEGDKVSPNAVRRVGLAKRGGAALSG